MGRSWCGCQVFAFAGGWRSTAEWTPHCNRGCGQFGIVALSLPGLEKLPMQCSGGAFIRCGATNGDFVRQATAGLRAGASRVLFRRPLRAVAFPSSHHEIPPRCRRVVRLFHRHLVCGSVRSARQRRQSGGIPHAGDRRSRAGFHAAGNRWTRLVAEGFRSLRRPDGVVYVESLSDVARDRAAVEKATRGPAGEKFWAGRDQSESSGRASVGRAGVWGVQRLVRGDEAVCGAAGVGFSVFV